MDVPFHARGLFPVSPFFILLKVGISTIPMTFPVGNCAIQDGGHSAEYRAVLQLFRERLGEVSRTLKSAEKSAGHTGFDGENHGKTTYAWIID